MSFKGTIALVGLALVAGGCQAQLGLAIASVVVGAILLSAAMIDAVVEGKRTRNDER